MTGVPNELDYFYEIIYIEGGTFHAILYPASEGERVVVWQWIFSDGSLRCQGYCGWGDQSDPDGLPVNLLFSTPDGALGGGNLYAVPIVD
ncbi:MAG: hypothetical protein ACOYB0_10600 [Polynucleobacter sp.]